jgi:phenylacetate-CoA ligase
MAGFLEHLYEISPVCLQQLAVTAWGLSWYYRRFGGKFEHYVDEFVARERFNATQWEEYQTRALRALLLRCYQVVPYYRDSLARHGLRESDSIHFTLDQLAHLPLLHKDTIRSNPAAFIASNVPRTRLRTYYTSGSTGTPLGVGMTDEVHRRISAVYEARCRKWAGVNYKMSRAMIGGRLVVPRANSSPPFYRYNRWERQVYFSAFHIAPQNAKHYVDALNRFHPDYLVGYASSHYFLARMIEEQGLTVCSPRCVLVSSEKLTEEMRSTLQRVYRCKVFDAYSGVEACCWASECEHHRMHVSPDVGIVEVLRPNGQPAKPGEEGELVATGLLNFVQPLVRYHTGDIVTLSEEPCPCGRAMPVVRELVGRLEDTVVGPDGREMVRFHGIFINLSSVKEGQIIQESLRDFTVRIVVTGGLKEADREMILSRMEQRLGKVRVRIEEVKGIERTNRGKFRAVICNLTTEERDRLKTAAGRK